MKVLSWEESFLESKKEKATYPPLEWKKQVLKTKHHKEIVASSKAHAATLTDEHHKAVNNYISDSSSTNYELRKGTEHLSPKDKRAHDKEVSLLDHVTKHEIPNDTVVYRGIHPALYNKPAGVVFHDKGYTGTSMSKKVAESFSSGSVGATRHVARIFLKKGDKAAYLPVSHGKGANPYYDDEKELLLHRGTHFKIIGHDSTGDTQYVDMETHHPEGKKIKAVKKD